MNNMTLYTITVLAWGSTWLVINFQLGSVAVEASVVYRYAIASLESTGALRSVWLGL